MSQLYPGNLPYGSGRPSKLRRVLRYKLSDLNGLANDIKDAMVEIVFSAGPRDLPDLIDGIKRHPHCLSANALTDNELRAVVTNILWDNTPQFFLRINGRGAKKLWSIEPEIKACLNRTNTPPAPVPKKPAEEILGPKKRIYKRRTSKKSELEKARKQYHRAMVIMAEECLAEIKAKIIAEKTAKELVILEAEKAEAEIKAEKELVILEAEKAEAKIEAEKKLAILEAKKAEAEIEDIALEERLQIIRQGEARQKIRQHAVDQAQQRIAERHQAQREALEKIMKRKKVVKGWSIDELLIAVCRKNSGFPVSAHIQRDTLRQTISKRLGEKGDPCFEPIASSEMFRVKFQTLRRPNTAKDYETLLTGVMEEFGQNVSFETIDKQIRKHAFRFGFDPLYLLESKINAAGSRLLELVPTKQGQKIKKYRLKPKRKR